MELLLGASSSGNTWRLLPQRAIFCPAESTLVVADVHLGKAASFRTLGVPVPGGTTAANLAALDALLVATAAQRLVFLGDLFHSAAAHGASQRDALAAWRLRHAGVVMVLVEGNHDALAGRPAADLRIAVVNEPYPCGGVQLCHYPQRRVGEVVLAGHMHPCIWLQGRGRDGLRLPCFWLMDDDRDASLLILPAFGRFTGGAPVTRVPGDRVFAVADDQLFEIPPGSRNAASGLD